MNEAEQLQAKQRDAAEKREAEIAAMRVTAHLDQAMDTFLTPSPKLVLREDRWRQMNEGSQMLDGKYDAKLPQVAEAAHRYSRVSLANFVCAGTKQRVAREQCLSYIERRLAEWGRTLLLHGPVGTGKDHLGIAVARWLMRLYGVECVYKVGAEMFAEIRDAIREEREHRTVKNLGTVPLLFISDISPVGSAWTDYQLTVLYRIIDRRYHELLPTIVTANVTKTDDLANVVGHSAASRLQHDAVSVLCYWQSIREVEGHNAT